MQNEYIKGLLKNKYYKLKIENSQHIEKKVSTVWIYIHQSANNYKTYEQDQIEAMHAN